MSQFYSSFKKAAEERAARQANGGNGQNFVKVGFFGSAKDASGNRVKYMTKSGDSALVRINYGNNPNELLGEQYGLHPAGEGVRIHNRPFQKVACLGGQNCPICKAIAAGNKSFGKATQRVYIPMVIAYKLPDGTYTTPEPVVMDGASYMVEKLVNLMGDYGELKNFVFKLTRSGSGTDTRYELGYIPTFDNENIITKASLDAFRNFDVTKHSYWVKSAEDMNAFLQTGTFPEVAKSATAETTAPVAEYAQPTAPAQTVTQPAAETRQPASQPTADTTKDYGFTANW